MPSATAAATPATGAPRSSPTSAGSGGGSGSGSGGGGGGTSRTNNGAASSSPKSASACDSAADAATTTTKTTTTNTNTCTSTKKKNIDNSNNNSINNKSQQQQSSGKSNSNSNSKTNSNSSSKRRISASSSSSSSSTNKRRRAGDGQHSYAATGSSGSSDSSSEDEDEIQQPDGWRVKLYRLNQDGSWDDCGTGRIVCLYSNTSNTSNDTSNNNSINRPHGSNNNNNNKNKSEKKQGKQNRSAADGSVGASASASTAVADDVGAAGAGAGAGATAVSATLAASVDTSAVVSPNSSSNNKTTDAEKSGVESNNKGDNGSSNKKDSDDNDNHDGSDNDNDNGSSEQQKKKQQQQQQQQQQQHQQQPHEAAEATLCVQAEIHKGSHHSTQHHPRVLLRTRILLTDAYQRQGDNIITWCEPCYYSDQETAETGVDLALSFQDNAGCLDIWRQITHVQSRAAALLRQNAHQQPVEDLAAQAAAQHHADIQQRLQSWDYQQQHHRQLGGSNSNGSDGHPSSSGTGNDGGAQLALQLAEQLPSPPTLQNLEDIADTIAGLQHPQQRESLAAWIAGDRDDECLYLKRLLALFPAAEARGDYPKLATLAACVKTILLLNDPSILELIVNVASIFEQVCSCLEYDPDLREKANHRWFLRERAKFRTVVPMEDPELVEAIHRSFRVNYLRDTLLRPTMDESSLSTLSSLQTFTHADVIKGVTMSTGQDATLRDSYLVRVIRLLGVELHTLGVVDWSELESSMMTVAPSPLDSSSAHGGADDHDSLAAAVTSANRHHHHNLPSSSSSTSSRTAPDATPTIQTDPSIVVGKAPAAGHSTNSTWNQYLAPQDYSVTARRLRRRGCLSFLKELFNMVRMSLQQVDKDDFFSVLCTLEIDLNDDREISDNVSQTSQNVEVGSVASTVRSDRLDEKTEEKQAEATLPSANLLSLLGTVLADPKTDTTEKGSVLEILAGIAMHDPSLIRRHCLKCHEQWKKERESPPSPANNNDDSSSYNDYISGRVRPNETNQVIYLAPPNDLLSSLLLLLDVETDAGILLQVSEIMRIILDTDAMIDHGPLSPGMADEAEGILPGSGGQNPPYDQHNQPSGSGATSTDQKRFLSMFYDHYVEWLVAPFHCTILQLSRLVPENVLTAPAESALLQRIFKAFEKGIGSNDPYLRTVPTCAIRTSFAVELLSFCVRAHLYRMKFFLLKSGVLGNVLKLLRPHPNAQSISGDRCLKLAALRFLRAILSVNDEFYHRHIIQHNLFAPVFEAFRANPVGDNLVSSAIVEMCDYIHSENIKSLLEYIVTKFLSSDLPENSSAPSLEAVSSPYVSTLTTLRKAYEVNIQAAQQQKQESEEKGQSSPGDSGYFPGGLHHSPRHLSGKALEEQRKFLEVDSEESYFEMDEDEHSQTQQQQEQQQGKHVAVAPVVDEVEAQEKESMHRTPRMFSLAQAPLLNNLDDSNRDREVLNDADSERSGDVTDSPRTQEFDDDNNDKIMNEH